MTITEGVYTPIGGRPPPAHRDIEDPVFEIVSTDSESVPMVFGESSNTTETDADFDLTDRLLGELI